MPLSRAAAADRRLCPGGCNARTPRRGAGAGAAASPDIVPPPHRRPTAADPAPIRLAAADASDRIASIRIEGNQRIEPGTILSYMTVQQGDAFDPDRLDRSLKTLYATGLFSDVNLDRVGDMLVVRVRENPIVNQIAFEGSDKVTQDTLRTTVQLRPRAVFTPAEAEADRDRLLALYAQKGRFAARITPKIIRLPDNRVNVVFEIHEGRASVIARIVFVGNHAFSESRLRDVISSRETAWWRFLSSADEYDPDRINYDRELLRRFYLRNGYIDFAADEAHAELSPDRGGFFVTFTIHEGQRFRIANVKVNSALAHLDARTVRHDIPLRDGDWYDGDAVERSVTRISDDLRNRGFAFVNVEPRILRNPRKPSVGLIFDISPGDRVFVERIDIVGNVRTKDKVIRREIRLAEGDPYSAELVRVSKQRLQDLNYFGKVSIDTTQGSAPDKALLTTNLTEKSTGSLTLGGGYSTEVGALLNSGLQQKPTSSARASMPASAAPSARSKTRSTSRSRTPISSTRTSSPASISSISTTATSSTPNMPSAAPAPPSISATSSTTTSARPGTTPSSTATSTTPIAAPASTSPPRKARRCCRRSARPSPSTIVTAGCIRIPAGSRAWAPTSPASAAPNTSSASSSTAATSSRSTSSPTPPSGTSSSRPAPAASTTSAARMNASSTASSSAATTCAASRPAASARATPPPTTTRTVIGGRFIWTQSSELHFPAAGMPEDFGLTGRAFVDVGALSEGDRHPESERRRSRQPTTCSATSARPAPPPASASVGTARSASSTSTSPIPVIKERRDKPQIFRFGFGTRIPIAQMPTSPINSGSASSGSTSSASASLGRSWRLAAALLGSRLLMLACAAQDQQNPGLVRPCITPKPQEASTAPTSAAAAPRPSRSRQPPPVADPERHRPDEAAAASTPRTSRPTPCPAIRPAGPRRRCRRFAQDRITRPAPSSACSACRT